MIALQNRLEGQLWQMLWTRKATDQNLTIGEVGESRRTTIANERRDKAKKLLGLK